MTSLFYYTHSRGMELHLLYINYNLQMKTEHILNVTDELLDDF